MTDLDLQVADSFERLFPVPRVGADWEDVLGRSGEGHNGRLPSRPGVLRGLSRRRRLFVVAAAALVAVLGVATAVGGVRALFLDEGFIGLPPKGATPSSPASGELVLSAYGVPRASRRDKIWVYGDGRMIWQREFGGPVDLPPNKSDVAQGANDISTGYLEQRLTREGVELLRSEVLSTGLFGDDLELRVAERSPVAEPFVPGISWIHVRNDDRLVRVRWLLANEGPGVPATPEQLSTLHRLIQRIAEPDSWLPPAAWEDRRIRAYVPSRFAVVFPDPQTPTDPSSRLALLPSPVADLLRSKGWMRLPDTSPMAGIAYVEVTTEEARSLAAALDAAGAERSDGSEVEAYRIETPGRDTPAVSLWFEPIFPHGEWICSACG